MSYLLTWRGTLVCQHRRNGSLLHRPLTASLDDVEPLMVGLPMDNLYAGFGHLMRGQIPRLPDLPPNLQGPLEGFCVSRSVDQRALHCARDGGFMTTDPDSEAITLQRTEAGDAQAFLPVEPPDLEALRHVLRLSWLIRSTGALVTQPGMVSQFTLQVGDLAADLRYHLPFDRAALPHRLTLLRDGWRIDQICRFDPMMYCSVFGNETIMEQFAVSLRSLLRFGQYDGRIAVLTDHTEADLAALLPAEDFARLTVILCDARDRIAFMVARHVIMDWQDAWQFQPLLYIDTDIVFDLELAPMLRTIAMSDRISAPLEPPATLATWPSMGAELLQRDFCSPGFAMGFNSGTLGIPNLATHADTLRLIRRIMTNHAALHGREALRWVDQEVANYVSYRRAHLDTGLISPFVRQAGAVADHLARRGLVHFNWVPGGEGRVWAMRGYMNQLAGVT